MLMPRFMECSASRGEPSTVKVDIVEGSGEAGRTIHVNAPFRGRFSIQKQTFHAEDRYRGWYDLKQRNHPHWRPISWKVRYLEVNRPCRREISWKVQGQQGEPSMLLPRIMEGSVSRSKPSTVKVDIMDGSI